jgi:excisionase family DNA binding protein
MTNWLTLDELASYLKRGRSTLYRMAQNGDIPGTKIGRHWRFDRDEIDKWLRAQAASPKKRQSPARRRAKRGV